MNPGVGQVPRSEPRGVHCLPYAGPRKEER